MNGASALLGTIVIRRGDGRAAQRRRGDHHTGHSAEVTTMPATQNSTPRNTDALPWGDHAPLFVSRRRAWLHAVLAGQESAPARPA